ncbi:hypothetical protein Dimus_037858 [Dionaea muscipula]
MVSQLSLGRSRTWRHRPWRPEHPGRRRELNMVYYVSCILFQISNNLMYLLLLNILLRSIWMCSLNPIPYPHLEAMTMLYPFFPTPNQLTSDPTDLATNRKRKLNALWRRCSLRALSNQATHPSLPQYC